MAAWSAFHSGGCSSREPQSAPPTWTSLLRSAAIWAIAQGVFGVPTFVIDGEIFWGHDAFEMVLDYLRNPEQFADEEMRRIDHLPVGVVRPRRTPSG